MPTSIYWLLAALAFPLAATCAFLFLLVRRHRRVERLLQGEAEETRAFAGQLSALHEVRNVLVHETTPAGFYRSAVEQGVARLGFERLGLFLYDPRSQQLIGSFGVDSEGRICDESDLTIAMGPEGIFGAQATPFPRLVTYQDIDLWDVVRDESGRPVRRQVGRGENILAALSDGAEVLGYLATDNLRTGRPLSSMQRNLFEIYAGVLGQLLSRLLRDRKAASLSDRLTMLQEVGNQLLGAPTLDDLTRQAVEVGRERLGLDRIGLFYYDPKNDWMVGTYGTDHEGHTRDEHGEISGVGVSQRPQDRLTLIIRHHLRYSLSAEEGLANKEGEILAHGSHILAPLWNGEEAIGYIAADNLLTLRPLDETDGEILCLYATHLGHLITRKRAEDEARRFNDRLTALHETGNALVKEAGFDDLCRAAIEMGRSRLGFERLGLWFYDAKRGTMHGAFGTDENGCLRDERHVRDLPLPDTTGAQAMRRQKPYVFDPDATLYGSRPDTPVGRGGKASAALWDGSEVIGFISTDNLLSGNPLTESDARFLSLYAATLGHLLTRKRNEEENEKLESQVRQAQKLESLGVLAGGIAHDFNNLLMGILGNADLALSDLSPASPARECLGEIQTASQRAAELCRQMLAYSGKGRFVIQAVDLGLAVEEMGHLLRVSISKSVILRYKFAPHLPRIEADPTQVRQIVMNLITNASEAIGERSGVIMISTGLQHCDTAYLRETSLGQDLLEGAYVYVEVSDNGCGMSRETLEKIFEPFFTTKFTGRGLGLAAVLGIVRGHSGTMRIYSEPGEGTTFKVLFPARSDEAPKPDEQPAKAAAPSRPAEGTILVVDDDETVRDVASRMLRRVGYDVLVACDGREAVDLFRRQPQAIDCVLLDLTMPRMSGEAAFAEIRAIRPGVPVVMASGYNEQEVARRFTDQAVPGFIQKPFQSADLARKIQEALQQSPRETAAPRVSDEAGGKK